MMSYVVIDTETTGMNPPDDKIVEIAFSTVDGVIRDTLVNPMRSISYDAMAIHHITDTMVANCESIDQIYPKLKQDISRSYFVAHNAAYDRSFLVHVDPMFGDVSRWVCTWRCALHIWPDAPGHGNQILRYWLGLNVDLPDNLYPHRALYDVLVTEALLDYMLDMYTMPALAQMSQQPALLSKVRFGKHSGQLWSQLPKDYLAWILRGSDWDEDIRYTAQYWYEK